MEGPLCQARRSCSFRLGYSGPISGAGDESLPRTLGSPVQPWWSGTKLLFNIYRWCVCNCQAPQKELDVQRPSWAQLCGAGRNADRGRRVCHCSALEVAGLVALHSESLFPKHLPR
ncbi:unnamed protein product [Rangifer tarandus platyrhynchus]|uniref:Uncharacterized protein n=1 Tax=Rangifer tarandus platyrhynchus TaxID=3082113 RepID=A0AC59Z2Z6_RANTA